MAGFVGDSLATEVAVDVSAVIDRYPGATFALIARRPDGTVYPAAVDMPVTEGTVRYSLTGMETALAGDVDLEIQARQGDAVVKSYRVLLTVRDSIGVGGEVPEDPAFGWVDEVLGAVTRAQAAAEEAAAAAADAREAAADINAAIADMAEQGIAFPEAPADSKLYGRKNKSWVEINTSENNEQTLLWKTIGDSEMAQFYPAPMTGIDIATSGVGRMYQTGKNLVDTAVDYTGDYNGKRTLKSWGSFPYPTGTYAFSAWMDATQATDGNYQLSCLLYAADGVTLETYINIPLFYYSPAQRVGGFMELIKGRRVDLRTNRSSTLPVDTIVTIRDVQLETGSIDTGYEACVPILAMPAATNMTIPPLAQINRETPAFNTLYADTGTFTTEYAKSLANEFETAYIEVNKAKPLYGKHIVNFGDSIFANVRGPTSVSDSIAKTTGATVYNCAFGGTRMSNISETAYNGLSMCSLADAIVSGDFSAQEATIEAQTGASKIRHAEALSMLKSLNFSEVTHITIAFGANDFGNGYVAPTNAGETKTTFEGAFRYTLRTLFTAFPRIRISICTPIYRAWLDAGFHVVDDSDSHIIVNKTLTEYIDVCNSIAKEFKVVCIDNYYTLGFNAQTRSYYYPELDMTLPNEAGRERMGAVIGRWMNLLG